MLAVREEIGKGGGAISKGTNMISHLLNALPSHRDAAGGGPCLLHMPLSRHSKCNV